MNIRKAFTMSEALIVLGIIAVIATLSVLAVQNAKPDPEIVMFKKAYKTTQDIMQNMYYDKELYPNATDPMEVAYNSDGTIFLAQLNAESNSPFAFNLMRTLSLGIEYNKPVTSLSTCYIVDLNGNENCPDTTTNFNTGSSNTGNLRCTCPLSASSAGYKAGMRCTTRFDFECFSSQQESGSTSSATAKCMVSCPSGYHKVAFCDFANNSQIFCVSDDCSIGYSRSGSVANRIQWKSHDSHCSSSS